ncbi:MAG: TonB-dependent receptor [Bacteroidota bacterium]
MKRVPTKQILMQRLLLLPGLLLVCQALFAQTITVKGVVKNETGDLVQGASVVEKGTKNGTTTGNDGQFQIKVKPAATLIFSYIGTQLKEEAVNNRTTVDVTLLDNAAKNSNNDVVVIGFGQVRRKDLTGAVSSIRGDELAKVPVTNIAQALQGRLAGVQVAMSDGTPGSNPSIKIRGGSSITQSNEPLYVVDGVPQTDGLNFLDPMDIESIDVLKDASATAIYGARGANGVVLVTTKQIKATKVTVNYDGYVGVKKLTNEIPVLTPSQYLSLMYERALSPAQVQSFQTNYGPYDSLQYYFGNRPGINWQREIFGDPVVSQYHKISINGGSKETKFNVFYSRNNDEGIMKESGAVKNIAKLTVNHKIGNKVTVNAIVNYSNQVISGLGTQEGGNARLSMLQTLLQYRPVNSKLGTDQQLSDFEVDPLDPNQSSPAFQSPLIKVQSQHRERTIRTLNANASFQYNFSKNLVYRGMISYVDGSNKAKEFNDARSLLAIRSGGPTGAISQDVTNRLNYNNTLSFTHVFKTPHKIDVTIGQEYVKNYIEGLSVSASGFPASNLGWNNLSLGTIPAFPVTYAEEDKLLSFFGRLNYSFNDKYLLTASVRRDGSSKFGSQNQWGTFPSVALAWRMINEKFIKDIPALSDLKLRLSYGQAGNNRIANYASLGIFTSGIYPLNNQVVGTAYQSNIPNPGLKWEAAQAANIGLDLGLFSQRITLTTEVYDNRSKDLLYNTRIPASAGFTTQFQNIGTTSSRGVEFTLNTTNIKSKAFTWNTNFNIAFNKTKVLGLSQGETQLLTNSYTTTNDYILQVGQPVGIMYGYIKEGLYQVSDFDYNATTGAYTLKTGVTKDNITVQPGFIKFKDISGAGGKPDGAITDLDRVAIGNANPKYTGGISNNFSYKGIDLSVFLNFAVGNDIYNANVLNNARLDLDYQNTLAIFADRWTTINPATGVKVTDPTALANLNAGKTQPVYNGNATGRLYNDIIEDGSFLRINNVSLGYTFPKKWLSKVKIANARIYFTAYNLHVFTNYSGYDPEVSVIRNALTPGVDFSAYPRGRSFITGLSLSF